MKRRSPPPARCLSLFLTSARVSWVVGTLFFCSRFMSAFLSLFQSVFCEHTCCRFSNMQRGQSNGCASCDSIPPTFETMRIIPNVAGRLPADVTRCIAQLSAYDEISALIRPTYVHHSSSYAR